MPLPMIAFHVWVQLRLEQFIKDLWSSEVLKRWGSERKWGPLSPKNWLMTAVSSWQRNSSPCLSSPFPQCRIRQSMLASAGKRRGNKRKMRRKSGGHKGKAVVWTGTKKSGCLEFLVLVGATNQEQRAFRIFWSVRSNAKLTWRFKTDLNSSKNNCSRF